MTAHVLPGEREKCLRYGMNDYLSKPLSEKALFNVLARFLPKQEKEATRSLQIDMNYLEEVAQGESSYVRELAQIFLEHLPKELATLEQALAQNDFTKVKNTAHSMRSTVGYIGFGESLGTLLKELEEEAQGQEVAALVQHIKYKCEEAMDMVKHQLLQFSPD
ncbi:MAG: Hpt domain-containing protein [Saprospiraceae bacterium]